MSAQEMPEWFRNYLENNTGFDLKLGRITSQSEAVRDFYDFIIKPENAAKLECVKELIFSNNEMLAQFQRTFGNGSSGSLDDCREFMTEALKPFKKEGSDEI